MLAVPPVLGLAESSGVDQRGFYIHQRFSVNGIMLAFRGVAAVHLTHNIFSLLDLYKRHRLCTVYVIKLLLNYNT